MNGGIENEDSFYAWRLLSMRKAVRSYRPEQIREEELDIILRSASLSPVGLGKFDNYRITVVQDKSLLARIDSATLEAFNGNPLMADATHGAPTLILISALANQNPEMPGLDIATVACIADTILFAATGLGLGSCYVCSIVEGISQDLALERDLRIKEGYRPLAGVLLGYPIEPLIMREVSNHIQYDRL